MLIKKMLRDMRRSLSAYLVCLVIVMVGFIGYSICLVCLDALGEAKQRFFQETDFCDGFAEVTRAPLSVVKELEKLPHVAEVEGGIAQTVPVRGMKSGEAELKILSFSQDGMNQAYLYGGRLPRAGEAELIVGKGFFEGNDLQIGEQIRLSAGGIERQYTVCGFGISPENMYIVKNLAEMLPSMAKYDAAFMDYDTMAGMFQMEGMANRFQFRMEPGYSFEEIRDEAEDILKPYGVGSTYVSDDDLSVTMVSQELDQLEKMAACFPVLFLGVAAVILYIMLHRLIDQQRTQIGTLMALGMKPFSVRLHYMAYGLLIGVVGGAAGGLFGNYTATPLIEYYRLFYQLPKVGRAFFPEYIWKGALIGGIFCALVSFGCTGSIQKQMPSEALRPAPPKTGKHFILEKIPGFVRLFTVPGIMGVRSLARYKRRTVLSVIGVASAFMLTATLVSMRSLFDVFLFDELEKNQRQDISVSFSDYVMEEDALALLENPRAERLEGVLKIGAKIYSASDSLDVSVEAIDEGAQLTRLYDEAGREIYVRREGAIISSFMCERLQVKKGDFLTLKISYPEEKEYSIPITDVMEQYLGTTIYMSKEALGNLAGYRGIVNSVKCRAPEEVCGELQEKLEDSPYKGTVETRQDKVDQYRTMLGSFEIIFAGLAILGVLVGLAVIYTSSLIYYEELKREISVLMMLGMRNKECLDVISVGQWIIAVFGILLGIPMTMGASRMISAGLASEMFMIPDFVDASSILGAVLLMMAALYISLRIMLGKLKKIVPVEMLRERE